MLFALVFVHGHGFGSFSLGVWCADWGSVFVDFGYVLAFSKLLKVIFLHYSLCFASRGCLWFCRCQWIWALVRLGTRRFKPTQGSVGGAVTALFDCNNNKPRLLHGAAIKLRSACVSLRLLWVSHNPRTSWTQLEPGCTYVLLVPGTWNSYCTTSLGVVCGVLVWLR